MYCEIREQNYEIFFYADDQFSVFFVFFSYYFDMVIYFEVFFQFMGYKFQRVAEVFMFGYYGYFVVVYIDYFILEVD